MATKKKNNKEQVKVKVEVWSPAFDGKLVLKYVNESDIQKVVDKLKDVQEGQSVTAIIEL